MEKNKCRIIEDQTNASQDGPGEYYCNGVPINNENRGEIKVYRDRKYRRIKKKVS